MSYNNDLGAAIGWDDELTAEEASFALLEPGDYHFVVESVARKQFDGSAAFVKLPYRAEANRQRTETSSSNRI